MRSRFVAGFLLLCLAVFLQIWIGDMRGVWFNISLGALIALSFFLKFPELLALDFLTLLMLSWRPGFSLESIVLGALPLIAYFVHKSLPLEPWVGNILLVLAGVSVLYLLFGFGVILGQPMRFAADATASLIASVAVFAAMHSFFGQEEEFQF